MTNPASALTPATMKVPVQVKSNGKVMEEFKSIGEFKQWFRKLKVKPIQGFDIIAKESGLAIGKFRYGHPLLFLRNFSSANMIPKYVGIMQKRAATQNIVKVLKANSSEIESFSSIQAVKDAFRLRRPEGLYRVSYNGKLIGVYDSSRGGWSNYLQSEDSLARFQMVNGIDDPPPPSANPQ